MDALSKKYGPLPGSVWLLIVFSAAFIFLKMRQSKKAAGAAGSGAGGTINYSDGTQNKKDYTTTSNLVENLGPGAGGQFTGTYTSTGPTTSTVDSNNTGSTVDSPHPATHVGVTPDHPHRGYHHHRQEQHSHGGHGGHH